MFQAVIHRVSSQMPQLSELMAQAVLTRLGPDIGVPSSGTGATKVQPSLSTKELQEAQPKASILSRLGTAPDAPPATTSMEAGPISSSVRTQRVKPGFGPYRPGSARKPVSGDHVEFEDPTVNHGRGTGGTRHPYDQTGPGKSFLDR